MTKLLQVLTVFVVVLVLSTDLAAAEFPKSRKNFWHLRGNTMLFASDYVDMKATVPRGWVSLSVDGADFLGGSEKTGGIALRGPDGWATKWPELNNGSHDNMLGRNGSVLDGMFLTKMITGWTLPDFELYVGFNDKRDHDLVVFLSDEVRVLRGGHPWRGRAWMRQNVMPDGKPRTHKVPGCVIVHNSGKSLAVMGFERGNQKNAQFEIGVVKDPEGTPRPALVFACKGMAANRIHFTAEPEERAENLILWPTLDVDASNEKKTRYEWCRYERDTDVRFNVGWSYLGKGAFDGAVELEIVHALGETHDHQIVRVQESHRTKDGKYQVALVPKLSMPGVSDVWIRLLSGTGEVTWVKQFRMMYDWRNFKPEYNAPPDMKEFWGGTLLALRKVPLDAEVKRVHEDHPEWEFYEVSYRTLRGKRVWACMYVPKEAKRPLPVMIGSHPSTRGFGLKKDKKGIYGSKVKKDPRFVTIVPLIRGHRPDAEDVPFNQPWWGPLDSRDDYVAREWYCTMVRGLDYLATRPDLADMSRVVSRGGSQGGALALVTAALDKRVTVCLADSPSNCMLHYSTRPETYGSFGPTIGQVPEGQTFEEMLRTLSYYDPAHMAPWITCPTYIGVTIGDLTVHSMGGLGVYHNLTSLPADKKGFYPGCNGHWHANSAAGGRKFGEMIEEVAKGE